MHTTLDDMRHVEYYFLPSKRNQQYHDALKPELSSLLLLHCSQKDPPVQYTLHPPIVPLFKNDIISEVETEGDVPQSLLAKSESTEAIDELMHAVSLDAVCFTTWKVLALSVDGSFSSLSASDRFQKTYHPQSDFEIPSPTFVTEIYSYGRKLSKKQKSKILNMVNFSKPTATTLAKDIHQLCLILEHSTSSENVNGVPILCRIHLCASVNGAKDTDSWEKNHSSAIREEVTSATSLRPLLCKLTRNLALVQCTSLCLDLFCGTGRLMQSMRGVTLGSDALPHFPTRCTSHSATIRHESDNITATCPNGLNFCLGNVYNIPYKAREQFDCIVCDPPYGRREVHVDAAGVDWAKHTSNEERARAQFQILTPLLLAASKLLRVGGRLVFLFINFPANPALRWTAMADLPHTERMRVLHTWREKWEYSSGHILARDTVVMEKF